MPELRAMATARRVRAAFTLLEVLLALAVLAVVVALITFAVPNLAEDSVDQSSLRIRSACERARWVALDRRIRVRLHLDVQAGEYWMVAEANPSEAPDEFEELEGDLSRRYKLPDGIRFGAPEIGPIRAFERAGAAGATAAIDFEPDGTADAAVIELAFGDEPDRRRWVVLEPLTGRVTVEREKPPLPELPSDGRLAEGVAGDRAASVDRLFEFGGAGLGGRNPNAVFNPRNRLGNVQLTEESESSRGEPASGLYPTVPGR